MHWAWAINKIILNYGNITLKTWFINSDETCNKTILQFLLYIYIYIYIYHVKLIVIDESVDVLLFVEAFV